MDEIDSWIKEAEENGEIAIDTETTSVNPQTADLVGISLSTEVGVACYIPIGHDSDLCLKKKEVINKLKPLLEDSSVKKIGQNMMLRPVIGRKLMRFKYSIISYYI